MLRKICFAGLAVLAMASTSQAAIAFSYTAVALPGGFNSLILHAHSTAGETINGVDTPTIVAGSGAFGGLPSQVWLNSSGSFKSPTAGDHTPGLWNAAYTPYDSFWFFDTTNSLSVGAGFDESNNGTGGVSGLPAGPLGAPYTGFGAMGTIGGVPGAKSFTIASGKQGTDVDLAQVVLKTGTAALVSGTILTNQGTNQTIVRFPIEAYITPEPVFLRAPCWLWQWLVASAAHSPEISSKGQAFAWLQL